MNLHVLLFALGAATLATLVGRSDELVFGAALFGAALGYLASLGARLRRLERRLDALATVYRSTPSGAPAAEETPPPFPSVQAATAAPSVSAPEEAAWRTTNASPWRTEEERDAAADRVEPPGPQAADAVAGRRAGPVAALLQRLRGWLARGNPVVQVGVVVTFFGIAFLLKYAAQRAHFPIELRLAAVALAGIALVALGWRLREGSRLYATVLQGGGVGVLYLVVYAAAKLYGLLPLVLALFVMVGLVGLSGVLAVRQNALPLAAFGAAGGFLAPVLVSTGTGSHVALFGYYAMLNAGILGIAWFRAWRVLNLLGFVFTFVIASAWGYTGYRPQHFTTTEPFLILFFLFYVAIAVLFAHRQQPQLRGYVDGSLVFGVPLVAFALQYALVRDTEYGLAITALALGSFYIGLAMMLWQRAAAGLRLLTEAFLALGVVFASLAIPLALDGRWTASAWALEGAALVWVGVRQGRWGARAFGVLLQLGSGVFFLESMGGPVGSLPVLNSLYLGALTVALAGLFSAWYLQRHDQQMRAWERFLPVPLLVWGLLWWLAAGAYEIERHLGGTHEHTALLALVAVTALLMSALRERLAWPAIGTGSIGLLPLLWLLLLVGAGDSGLHSHPMAGWGLPSWVLGVGAHLYLLRREAAFWPQRVAHLWHPLGFWLLLFLLSLELHWAIGHWLGAAPLTWQAFGWAMLPGLSVAFLWRYGPAWGWPVATHFRGYAVIGQVPPAAYLLLWFLAASTLAGDPRPLPYVPLLNPLDLAQLFALLAAARWAVWLDRSELRPAWWPAPAWLLGVLGGGGFLWTQVVLARAVHFWGGVGYSLPALYHSVVFQTSLSILWALWALGLTLLSSRRQQRNLWLIGAALLAAVVLKLFVVDLAGIGTLARIVSFLAVGALMLVIGWFSPLPPRAALQTKG